jgi:hypothetical protein
MPGLLHREGVNRPSSDNGSDLSDSNPDLSSDDDGCSSEGEFGRSGSNMNIPWDALDEQRLLAWKEGKSWQWIFCKFPGRSTRLNIVPARGE